MRERIPATPGSPIPAPGRRSRSATRGMDDPSNGRGREPAGAGVATSAAGSRGRGRGGRGRVEGPARTTSGGRMDLVSESSAMRAASSVADDCRRLAERLRLDAVGVAIGEAGRQVTWWAAPDGPPLPSRLDDVLGGADPAWLLVAVASGDTVFARPTPRRPNARSTSCAPWRPRWWRGRRRHAAPRLAPAASARRRPPPSVGGAGDRGPDRPVGGNRHPRPGRRAGDARPRHRLRDGVAVHAERHRVGAASPAAGHPGVARGARPLAAGPVGDGVRFADAHDVPGIGPRLAALGCSSLAVLASTATAGSCWTRRPPTRVRNGWPGRSPTSR